MENPFRESPSSRVAPVAATENTRPTTDPTAAPQNINLNTTRHSTDTTQTSTLVPTPELIESSLATGLVSVLADMGVETRRSPTLPAFYDIDDEVAVRFRPIDPMPSPVLSHRSQNSHVSRVSSRHSQDEVVNLAHRLADDLALSFRQRMDDSDRERERERETLTMRFQQQLE